MEIKDIAIKCLRDEARAIENVIPCVNSEFEAAVRMILNCRGKVLVMGVGKSGHIGSKIAATLASTGTPSFFVNPLDAYHGDLGMACQEDILIAISYSGETVELNRLLPSIEDRKVRVIAMTGNPDSLLAQHAECTICIRVEYEACPLNLAPTSSTTVALAMGDALACALMEMRHFKAKDFAKLHPGGSLGKHLSKVADYMVTDNLPIVAPSDKLCDAMIEISRCRHGLAIVCDGGSIAGVITDGDVRRAMYTSRDRFFELTVSEVMNRNPKTVREQDRLRHAESLMHTHKINVLIVTDSQGRLKGLIDSINCF